MAFLEVAERAGETRGRAVTLAPEIESGDEPLDEVLAGGMVALWNEARALRRLAVIGLVVVSVGVVAAVVIAVVLVAEFGLT